jgi:GT2 family glycosyltransferase
MTAERSAALPSGHPAAVPGNRWDLLAPAPDCRWTPTATVSVCIPARNAAGLRRTLATLGVQTYPHELMEVVVVDDGSDPPLDLGDGWPFRLRVLRSAPAEGFGAGRARNLAARAAGGRILMFLDADVVPERQVVEAYARWFERSALAVPMGLCRFVEMDGLTTEQLVAAIAGGTMADRFAGREVDDQSWREQVFARTDDLRVEAVDAFRAVIGATMAVSAEQFHAVGGFRELGIRGIEDTEFGYRLHANGALLIVDRAAVHWHQGRRSFTSEQRAAIKATRVPYVERLLPLPGFRRAAAPPNGPVDTVPVLLIHIDPVGAPADQVAAAAERIERHCGTDVRIVPSRTQLRACNPSFAALTVPATVHWDAITLPAIVKLFTTRRVGVIRVLQSGGAAPIEIVRTRALRRAVHVLGAAAADADLVRCAGELFGTWWAHPAHLGLAPPVGARPAVPAGSGAMQRHSDATTPGALVRRACALGYRVVRKVLRLLAA